MEARYHRASGDGSPDMRWLRDSEDSTYALTLRLLRDDGAVVYLNGVEVFRSNMPAGPITFTTLASTDVSGAAENTFVTASLNPALLVNGPNLLAVEIHQSAPGSDDLSFDLELIGIRTP